MARTETRAAYAGCGLLGDYVSEPTARSGITGLPTAGGVLLFPVVSCLRRSANELRQHHVVDVGAHLQQQGQVVGHLVGEVRLVHTGNNASMPASIP